MQDIALVLPKYTESSENAKLRHDSKALLWKLDLCTAAEVFRHYTINLPTYIHISHAASFCLKSFV